MRPGLRSAALVAVVMMAAGFGTAAAAHPTGPPSHLSSGAGSPVATEASTGRAGVPITGGRSVKCHTGFGTPVDDGVLAVEDPTADVAVAADFSCKGNAAHRTFDTVTVQGTFGEAESTMFAVTVYGNDRSGALPEPRNGAGAGAFRPAQVVCATQRITGTPTGAVFPDFDTTVITLDPPCTAKRKINWLEVQAVPESAPWYWRLQSDVGGRFEADLLDGEMGTGCAPGYNDDLTIRDCIYGGAPGKPDVMFELTSTS